MGANENSKNPWTAYPKNPLILLFFLVVTMGQTGCHKTDTPDFQIFQTGTTDELSALHFWDDQNGMVAGGKTWTRGLRLTTRDGGQSWTRDSLYDKQILSLTPADPPIIYGVGIDRQIYRFLPDASQILRFGGYKFYRGALAVDNDRLWIVGGESFGTGYLDYADTQKGILENRITIDRELDAICSLDSNHLIIAGFGILLITENAGKIWDTLVMRDHWRDICKTEKGTAVAVGIGGNIIRTRNYGKTWEFIRRGSQIFVPGLPLRAVAFASPTDGLAAGENGVVMRTRDGGENWIRQDGLPKVNYLDIEVMGNQYWLCGSEGMVIRLE